MQIIIEGCQYPAGSVDIVRLPETDSVSRRCLDVDT